MSTTGTRTTSASAIDAFHQRGTLREVTLPALGARDLLVRVEAIGVNPADWKIRDGMIPNRAMPMVLGSDFAGVVEATGGDVAAWRGKRVVGSTPGAYAHELVVSADGVVAELPGDIDAVTAATLPVPGLTALAVVDHAAPEGTESVLIVGAGGAVGRLAGAIAQAHGLIALGLGSGDDLGELLAQRRLNRVDAVIDTAGDAALLDTLADRIRPGGRLISITFAVDPARFTARGIQAENLNACSTHFFSADGLRELLALVERGTLHPRADTVRPFADALDVLDGVKDGTLRWKYVLTP